uniref:Raptor N-terminal CASPase-like domain-containing protein n=1 Tax=Romanomermis culicivorax TaxID=13658 RepID=A0A915HUM9_ROMCU
MTSPKRDVSICFAEKRHADDVQGEKSTFSGRSLSDERLKTFNVGLILCLNIGVEPPDFIKPSKCAKFECWIDPFSLSKPKSTEMIGITLQKLYQRMQSRARCRTCGDPTIEDVKKLCSSLRRGAKEDRVLMHYNGHGVPRPTSNGEIWVFNRNYTQYIPLSIVDLHIWTGSPCIYVWECNNADAKKEGPYQHPTDGFSGFVRGSSAAIIEEVDEASGSSQTILHQSTPPVSTLTASAFKDCIHMAACQAEETLPTNPEIPADLFTSCLTSPVKTAVMWHILRHGLQDKVPWDITDKFPGQPNDNRFPINDRKSLMGELNWILTTITDTIAFEVLPRELFYKLFRQDTLLAMLFRNFLLADRIMRHYGCTPISYPALLPTCEHAMWQAWDYTLDVLMNNIVNNSAQFFERPVSISSSQYALSSMQGIPPTIQPNDEQFRFSFFINHLTAFEVWLNYGPCRDEYPLLLPIILQVLLSQTHRIRGLELLERFVDLGAYAVDMALAVGIFTYILKLLQSPAVEIRPHLTFLWAKVLAFQPENQRELIREDGIRYFLRMFNEPAVEESHKLLAAFILFCCMDKGLGRQWNDFDAARWQGIRLSTHEKLYDFLSDPSPEVRSSAVYALGTLISNRADENEHATSTSHSIVLILVQKVSCDASPLVRRELVVALHWLILNFENQFVTVAYEMTEKKMSALLQAHARLNSTNRNTLPSRARKPPRPSSKASSPTANYDEVDTLQDYVNNLTVNSRKNFLSIAENLCAQSLLPPGDDSNQSKINFPRTGSSHSLQSSSTSERLHPSITLSKIFGFGAVNGVGRHRRKDSLPINLESKSRSSSLSAHTGNVYVTVWRSILNFASDPDLQVSRLANRVIEHINHGVVLLHKTKMEFDMDSIIGRRMSCSSPDPRQHNSNSASVDAKTSESEDDSAGATKIKTVGGESKPVFIVGSPETIAAGPPAPIPKERARMRCAAGNRPIPPAAPNDEDSAHPVISIYSTIFTSPRRPVFGIKIPSNEDKGSEIESHSPAPQNSVPILRRRKAVVETEFVQWCRKRFLEPILHLFTFDAKDEQNLPPVEYGHLRVDRKRSELFDVVDNTKRTPMDDRARDTITMMEGRSENDRLTLKRVPKFDSQTFLTRSNRSVYSLQYMPYRSLLCAGENGSVSFWNTENGSHFYRLNNDTSRTKSNVSFIDFVNPTSSPEPYVLTGTEDGEIRVWDCKLSKRYVDIDARLNSLSMNDANNNFTATTTSNLTTVKPRLVSAWNTVPFWIKSKLSLRATFFWEQEAALLMMGGESNVIAIWDAHQEQKTQEIALPSFDGFVVSITADTVGHHIIAAGCTDGAVRLFDCRVPDSKRRLTTLGHLRDSPADCVRLQDKSVGNHLVACSSDGSVCVWDPRLFREPLHSFSMADPVVQKNMQNDLFGSSASLSYNTSLPIDIHPRLDLVAWASESNAKIRLANFEGQFLEPLQYHDGFMGQRLSAIHCLKFHPYTAQLAFGSNDHLLGAFGLSG